MPNRPPRRGFVLCLLTLIIILSAFAPPSQQAAEVTLAIDAGFEGFFRDQTWMPVRVQVANDGAAIEGRITARPATNPGALSDEYSTPVTLASGARQTIPLLISPRGFAQQIQIELIDTFGNVIASERTPVRGLLTNDKLIWTFTTSAFGAPDLSAMRLGGHEAFQAVGALDEIGGLTPALDAVDVILFNDLDTSPLSIEARTALADWVAAGGHLIIGGGANGAATADGLRDLLPMPIAGAASVPDVVALIDWLRLPADETITAREAAVITGTPSNDTTILVSTVGAAGETLPLIVRREIGVGVVDQLAFDPMAEPLRGWDRLPDLWFTLATTRAPLPDWAGGVADWASAARAVEILPGIDPLPDILPLVGFLLAYIALIGPINYWLLNRINRREWAWFTIPLLIIGFSALAWVVGANLRGTEALLNRLAVVQAWPTAPRARVEGIFGLLSPRRAGYDLNVVGALRPLPPLNTTTSVLNPDTRPGVNIGQTDRFTASDVVIDASFVAGFHTQTTIERPPLRGSATIVYDERTAAGMQQVRGSVANDGETTLHNPVILARGVALRLERDLEPGAVESFALTLVGEGDAAALSAVGGQIGRSFITRSSALTTQRLSFLDVMGSDEFSGTVRSLFFNAETPEEQIELRRAVLASAVVDFSYNRSGRGDRVTLAGWTDDTPITVAVDGASGEGADQSETLVWIELETAIDEPQGIVTITPDRFTWVAREYDGMGEPLPFGLVMQPGDAREFQFTPLPTARLSAVGSVTIMLDEVSAGARQIPINVWDWDKQGWESIDVVSGTRTLTNPARFVGAENAIRVRLNADDAGGYLRLARIRISQTGSF